MKYRKPLQLVVYFMSGSALLLSCMYFESRILNFIKDVFFWCGWLSMVSFIFHEIEHKINVRKIKIFLNQKDF